jgi:hypothetical protein
VKAWPFLFTRGYVRDYQFVVCPRMFATERKMGAFRRLVGPLADCSRVSGESITADDPVLGGITLFYYSKSAKIGGKEALDVGNRSVMTVLGLVFDKIETKNPDFGPRAERLLQDQLPHLIAEFEGFWDSRIPRATILSDAIIVQDETRPRERQEMYRGLEFYRKMMLLAGVILAISIACNIVGLVQFNRQGDKLLAQRAIYEELKNKCEEYNKETNGLRVENNELRAQLKLLGH